MTDAAIRPEQATTIDELADALTHEWYAASDGDYARIPTWGPRTDLVWRMLCGSCPEGDIASWDTTSTDPAQHRYVLRTTDSGRSTFHIASHAEVLARYGMTPDA